MSKYSAQIAVLFIFVRFYVFSQENEIPEPDFSGTPLFSINSLNFNITGRTKISALLDSGSFVQGEEITGLSGLENYIQEKSQLLYNERVLESAHIDYFIGQYSQGKYPVDLLIDTKDSWNFIVFPKPEYSSSNGFSLTLCIRDYNFLGLMQPFKIDLGYKYDELNRTIYNFLLDSNLPFGAFRQRWIFDFDHDFEYRPDFEEPFQYIVNTGLSVKLPVGIKPGSMGEITYNPKLSLVFNHEFSQLTFEEIQKRLFLSFYHNLELSNINWAGNLRKGLNFCIENSFIYNLHNSSFKTLPLDNYIYLSGISHFIVKENIFGISARMMYRHWLFSAVYGEAADVLRGVIDKEIQANYMFSLNLDFPLRILKFKPSEYFNNRKLRVFNFDLFLSPFFDFAIFKNKDQMDTNPVNRSFTGGMEALVFPDFFRSLNLCISFGYNFSRHEPSNSASAGKYEIYIGTDLFF